MLTGICLRIGIGLVPFLFPLFSDRYEAVTDFATESAVSTHDLEAVVIFLDESIDPLANGQVLRREQARQDV